MVQKKDFRPIYKQLLSHCQSYAHDGAWQKLPLLGGICRGPGDPMAAVNDLQQHFSQPELLQAGVLVTNEPADVQLAPELCDPQTIIFPLKKRPNDDPFDLVSEYGVLSGRRLPLCAALHDGRVRALIKAMPEKILCVATTAAPHSAAAGR